MNETKNEAEQVNTEKNNNAADPAKKEAETSPERKEGPNTKTDDLEERERKLAEREKAIEISERKIKAKELMTSKELPVELMDFLNYTNDDTMTDSINRLEEIFKKYSKNTKSTGMTATFSTGFRHEHSATSENDAFIKGLYRT